MADPEDRLLGKLSVTVFKVANLHKVTSFGVMDPYVVIGLNQDKKHTRTIEDGGKECEFNETLHFNIDCQKMDLISMRVKTKTTFSSATIGVFSLKMSEFIKLQKKKLKFQLVDENTFEDRGTIEVMPEYHGTHEVPMPATTPVPATSGQAAVPKIPSRSHSPMPPPPQQHIQQPMPISGQIAQQMAQLQVSAPPPVVSAPPPPVVSAPPPQQQLSVAVPTPYQPPQQVQSQEQAAAQSPEGQPNPLPPPPIVQGQPIPPVPIVSPQPIVTPPVVAPVPTISPPVVQQQQQPPPQQQQQPPYSPSGPPGGAVIGGAPVAQPIVGGAPIAQPIGYHPPQPVIAPPVVGGQIPYHPPQQQQQGFIPQPVQHFGVNQPPQQPYGQPPQQPYGQPPQPPYGLAPPPYGQPPQQPYGSQPFAKPPQQPYGVVYQQPVQQPYGSQQIVHPPSPYASQQPVSPYGSQPPPQQQPQQQMAVAPFQTLAVGRPHADSRMYDDLQYLGQRAPFAQIAEIRIFANLRVTGMQLVYNINGQLLDGPIAGAAPIQPNIMRIDLQHGEQIQQISGRVSAVGLESLIIKSTKQYLRYGTSNDGQDFQLNIPQGHHVVGFHGSFAPSGITSFGAYSKP